MLPTVTDGTGPSSGLDAYLVPQTTDVALFSTTMPVVKDKTKAQTSISIDDNTMIMDADSRNISTKRRSNPDQRTDDNVSRQRISDKLERAKAILSQYGREIQSY